MSSSGTPALDFSLERRRLDAAGTVEVRGRVVEVTGLIIRARIPGVRIGEVCTIHTHLVDCPVLAEVVGFRDRMVDLMVLGELGGVGPDSEVVATGRPLSVPVGDGLLGRVLDGLGRPIDDKGPLTGLAAADRAAYAVPPEALSRRPIREPLSVGVRSIDACLTLGRGQRMGIYAGAGHGKTTLLAMMARNASSDVNVIALVGERGREVADFLEQAIGKQGLGRSVVVVATSDQPALVRLKAAYVATTIAEHFRDQGRNVLFLMDSITRFARAQREVGLAVGEPPARSGFPPSVFAILPQLLERTGNSSQGSISAFYTVLVEGDDLDEPIAHETRSILDGHIVLDRELAARGHYPAIDLLRSTSRLFETLAATDQRHATHHLRDLLGAYEKHQDLILVGAYEPGSEPLVDEYLEAQSRIVDFRRQGLDEATTGPAAAQALQDLFATEEST